MWRCPFSLVLKQALYCSSGALDVDTDSMMLEIRSSNLVLMYQNSAYLCILAARFLRAQSFLDDNLARRGICINIKQINAT